MDEPMMDTSAAPPAEDITVTVVIKAMVRLL